MYRVKPEDWNNHPILKKAIDTLVRNIIRRRVWKKLDMVNPRNPEAAAPPEEIKKMVVKFLSHGNVKAGKVFASSLLVDRIDGYDEACEDLGGPSKYSPDGKYKCLKRARDYSDKEFLKGFAIQYEKHINVASSDMLTRESRSFTSRSKLIKIIKEEIAAVVSEIKT